MATQAILGTVDDNGVISQKAWAEVLGAGVASAAAMTQADKDACNDRFIVTTTADVFVDVGAAPDGSAKHYLVPAGTTKVIPAYVGQKIAYAAVV